MWLGALHHSGTDEADKDGVDDGVRTRDHWSHSPVLYQLSYIHRHQQNAQRTDVARLEGIEPPTDGLEIRCSIRLSYRRGAPSGANRRGRQQVGARGFEPPTSCSQSRCATGLRYAPVNPCSIRRRRIAAPARERQNSRGFAWFDGSSRRLSGPAAPAESGDGRQSSRGGRNRPRPATLRLDRHGHPT